MKHDAWFDSDENKILLAICSRKLISNIGIGGIIWGVINIAIGAVAISDTIINAGLVLLGFIMLGTGIQALRRPTLGVLLAETLVTVLLFFWDLGITILNTAAGEPFDPQGVIFTLIIAGFFAGNYIKLGHIRDLIANTPKEKILATKQICKTILKKKLKEEPLVAQTTNRKCRVQFMGDRAFFIQRDQMRAFVGSQTDIQNAVAKPDAKSWLLAFNHPLGKLKYRFDKKNTAKLKTWLATEPAAT